MAKARSATTKPAEGAPPQIPAEERQRLIAEAAYFRALARGFEGGDPLEDWLTAEQEIDRGLSGPVPQQEAQATS